MMRIHDFHDTDTNNGYQCYRKVAWSIPLPIHDADEMPRPDNDDTDVSYR